MTTSKGSLEALYQEYLASGLQPGPGLALSRGLAAAGLREPAMALENYFQSNSAAQHTIPIASIGGRPTFAGPLPPQSPQLGQVWFDLCEVCPMILVPNTNDAALRSAYWVTLHPVYVWQFRAFLSLVRYETGRTEFPVPKDLMAPERLSGLGSTDYVTGVYHDEAVAYGAWFGKSLCGRMTLKFLRAFGGEQLLDVVLPQGMRLWDGAEVSSSEFLRIAVGRNTLDRTPWHEEELRDAGESVAPADQMLFEEWEKQQDIGFVTCISVALGLGRKETASTIHMQLHNVLPRVSKANASASDPVRAKLTSFITNRQRVHDLDLHDADLAGADLRHLSADGVDLQGADLRGTHLREARLGECRLERASLADADWSSATLRLCALDGAHGVGACFDGARLEDSTAVGADLSRASLRGAHLTETSFSRTVLRAAVLDHAKGDGVEFRGADLAGASLVEAALDEADFRGADLRGANLSKGRFHSADFRGALLDGARFDGSDCAGAWFDEGSVPRAESAPEVAGSSTLSELAAAIAASPNLPAEIRARLEQAATRLDLANEPPEEWKPLLEPLMKLANGEISLDEVLRAIQESGHEEETHDPGV
jgi:uncharacterized protein YjbI with pentapeptide repeats